MKIHYTRVKKWFGFFCYFMLTLVGAVSAANVPIAQRTDTQQKPTLLIVKPYQITVDGKTATVYRIEQPNGTWGFHGIKGQDFNVIVKNEIAEPTVIHWHGLLLPNSQDGVPYVTQLPILPGQEYHYDFKLVQAGTYWMHSHYQFQLQQLLSAPLIIEDPNDANKNEQNVVLLLTDFSFKKPDIIWKDLRKDEEKNKQNKMTHSMSKSMAAPDLNDVKYDAYLTNYRTLTNPEVVTVKPGAVVRLRLIDGAAGSNYFIHLGSLTGTAIAADGESIEPLKGSIFTLAMGQRLDVLVKIPEGPGVYPILAQGEGTTMQTGLILATSGAKIPAFSNTAATVVGAVTNAQELELKALHPLAKKPIDRVLTVNLEGDMSQYKWTINGQAWPNITPFEIKQGQRVEIIFNNKTSMSHPMHLHGHVFEVIEIDGKPIQGALRDTVLLTPNSTMKVILDADNSGNWLLHCHLLYHGAAGMMTLVDYEGYPKPDLNLIKKEDSM